MGTVAGWRCLKLIKLEYNVITGELTEIVVDYPNEEMEPQLSEPTEPTLEEKVAEHDTKIVTLEETLEALFG